MRVKTLIAAAALAVTVTGTLATAVALPAAAAPTKPFPAMTPTDLKLFCQKNGGEYKGSYQGDGIYTCKLPNGRLVHCYADEGICKISLEPEPTTSPRWTVEHTAVATATH
jgi:putative hemolysin